MKTASAPAILAAQTLDQIDGAYVRAIQCPIERLQAHPALSTRAFDRWQVAGDFVRRQLGIARKRDKVPG